MIALWQRLADWCLPPTLLDATWLTEGDPAWGYVKRNGAWVLGRGEVRLPSPVDYYIEVDDDG